MTARKPVDLDGTVRLLAKLLLLATLATAIIAAFSLVAWSPLLIYSLYDDDRDWARLGDIGQAYGQASALLSTAALIVVSASLAVQRNSFRRALRDDHRRRNRETVLLSMRTPAYSQCWGSRFAPAHVDERLFYFAGFVVLNWEFAWEDRVINERELRVNLRSYFDSEVPRMYWERYGDWHDPQRRWPRRDRFRAIVNEEYLRAIKNGPPARCHEPMTDGMAERPLFHRGDE
ncbi:DUF6082 family protein [Dactylosporangium sp. NPDC051541]|uniref:DUF6082 family protein n=1 Tax=Dactylosporangium sp. NPDC051541 TaxID=3363977 RepID=UPI00378853F6